MIFKKRQKKEHVPLESLLYPVNGKEVRYIKWAMDRDVEFQEHWANLPAEDKMMEVTSW